MILWPSATRLFIIRRAAARIRSFNHSPTFLTGAIASKSCKVYAPDDLASRASAESLWWRAAREPPWWGNFSSNLIYFFINGCIKRERLAAAMLLDLIWNNQFVRDCFRRDNVHYFLWHCRSYSTFSIHLSGLDIHCAFLARTQSAKTIFPSYHICTGGC